MPSRIAGIIDCGGGFRVVVTDGDFAPHLAPGEELHILPDVTVDEPVPMADWPNLVRMVDDYLQLVCHPPNNIEKQ